LDNNINATPMFSVPLYTNSISVLENEISFIKKLPYQRMVSDNGDYTVSYNILNEKKLTRLRFELEENIKCFADQIYSIDETVDWHITTSWCNKHGIGDWGHSHYHKNSLFSGVFYFDVPENSGDLVMENHSPMLPFPPTIEFKHKDYNIFNSRVWSVKPVNNLLVLFPSFLRHYVKKNESDSDRYSVAFNVFFRGSIGEREASIKI